MHETMSPPKKIAMPKFSSYLDLIVVTTFCKFNPCKFNPYGTPQHNERMDSNRQPLGGNERTEALAMLFAVERTRANE